MTHAKLLQTVALVLADLKVPEGAKWTLYAPANGMVVPLDALLRAGVKPGEWYGPGKGGWQRTYEIEMWGLRVYCYEVRPEADIDPAELPKPAEHDLPEADDTQPGWAGAGISIVSHPHGEEPL